MGKSKRIPPKPTFCPEWVLVTVELAKQWLASMRPNRYLSPWLVEAFARDLASGRYEPTHQGVAFDTQGRLCDGQHRLEGIVRADVPAWLLVTRGLSEAAVSVIDTGRTRQLKDRYAIAEGETQTKDRISIARLVAYAYGPARSMSESEILELAKQLKPEIDWFLGLRTQLVRYAPVSAAFVYAYPCEPEKISKFIDEVTSGDGLRIGNPALTLRNALLQRQNKYTNGEKVRVEWFRKTLNAMRHYIQGDSQKQLKDTEAGLQFFARSREGSGS